MLGDRQKTAIVAHRGAPMEAPENTVRAVERAIALGADMVEFDVRRTHDRVLVAHHDEMIEGKPVRELTFRSVHKGDFGPDRVEDLVKVAGGRVRLDVELKEEGYEDEVLNLVDRYVPPDQYVITSFRGSTVRTVKQLRPSVTAGLLLDSPNAVGSDTGEVSHEALIERARDCGADFIAPHYRLADLGLVARAALHGLLSLVWTVNDRARLQRYMADPAVVGIVTDKPEVRDLGSAQVPGCA